METPAERQRHRQLSQKDVEGGGYLLRERDRGKAKMMNDREVAAVTDIETF